MKKKSASQSAFFNLRVLVGLFIGLVGVSLALLATANPLKPNVASSQQKYKVTTKSQYISPLVPPGFDCSSIHELGLDKMENLRAGAIMIFCGLAKGGEPDEGGGYQCVQQPCTNLTAPVTYGGTTWIWLLGRKALRTLFSRRHTLRLTRITPTRSSSLTTTLEAPTTNNFSGASVSNDGGLTFTRLTTASGQSPFANTFGDPVILYNKPSQTWFTIWIDAGCGGWRHWADTSPPRPMDPNSWTHFCVHNGRL